MEILPQNYQTINSFAVAPPIERISSLELIIIDFDEEQSVQAGLLRRLTRQFGLSLGDRACLSLAIVKKIPVLTADQAWLQLNLPIDIRTIR